MLRLHHGRVREHGGPELHLPPEPVLSQRLSARDRRGLHHQQVRNQ